MLKQCKTRCRRAQLDFKSTSIADPLYSTLCLPNLNFIAIVCQRDLNCCCQIVSIFIFPTSRQGGGGQRYGEACKGQGMEWGHWLWKPPKLKNNQEMTANV